jgi:hypothetical protein
VPCEHFAWLWGADLNGCESHDNDLSAAGNRNFASMSWHILQNFLVLVADAALVVVAVRKVALAALAVVELLEKFVAVVAVAIVEKLEKFIAVVVLAVVEIVELLVLREGRFYGFAEFVADAVVQERRCRRRTCWNFRLRRSQQPVFSLRRCRRVAVLFRNRRMHLNYCFGRYS